MVELSDQFGGPYFPKGRGQGKLFSDPKPIDVHRYPRGYAPERMAEIRAAPTEISVLPKRSQATTDPFQVRQIQESIARSTTPASDLESLSRIKAGVKSIGGGQYTSREVKLRGAPPKGKTYNFRKKSFKDRGFDFGQQSDEHTLMHELGHHRSQYVERTPHSRYATAEEQGQDEAYADANMIDRFRPDPRWARRGQLTDMSTHYERMVAKGKAPHQAGSGSSYRFAAGYSGMRRELASRWGVSESLMRDRAQRKNAEDDLAHRQQTADLHVVNNQFFHRDYDTEGETGKPAWKTNPKHIWNDRRG